MARPATIGPLSANEKIRILVYAHPGRGKTVFASTSAEIGKTLVIRSPVDHIPRLALDSGAEQALVRNWDEMYELLEFLRHEPDAYDWVWLDSISLWQDVGLDDVFQAAIERKPSRREYGPDKGEYGINMGRLAEWVRFVVGANAFHFGVTAHPIPMMDPVTDGLILMPWVQGKQMAEKICGYMNLVCYLEVRERRNGTRYRAMYSQATEDYYAKDQFDAFEGGKMLNPTMKKVVEAINANAPKPARRRTSSRRRARG
jgi:AAA domain